MKYMPRTYLIILSSCMLAVVGVFLYSLMPKGQEGGTEGMTRVRGQLYNPEGGKIAEKVDVMMVEAGRIEGQDMALPLTIDVPYDYLFYSDERGAFDFQVPNGSYIFIFHRPWQTAYPGRIGVVSLQGQERWFDLHIKPYKYSSTGQDESQNTNYRPAEREYRIVEAGDSLWEFAREYYGTGAEWPKIYAANNISLLQNGAPLLHPGDELFLPPPSYEIRPDDGLTMLACPVSRSFYRDPRPWATGSSYYIDDAFPIEEQWEGGITMKKIPDISEGREGTYFHLIGPEKDHIEGEGKYRPWRWFSRPVKAYADRRPGVGQLEPSDCHECALSPDGARKAVSSYRFEDNKYAAFEYGKTPTDWYDYVDQLVFSPDSRELSFRARIGSEWHIVRNGKKGESYHYVHTAFYTQDGSLYGVVQLQDTKWAIVKNGNVIHSYTFIDSVQYTQMAEGFAYRAKRSSSQGEEQWSVIIDGREMPSWNYVGNVYHAGSGEVWYRARGTDGLWRLVKGRKEKGEEVLPTAPVGSEIVSFFIAEGRADISPLALLKDHAGEYVLSYDNETPVRYETISNVTISAAGSHLAYWGHRRWDVEERSLLQDFVVDNTWIRKVKFYEAQTQSSRAEPLFIRAYFSDNAVLILSRQNKSVVAEEYDLGNIDGGCNNGHWK